MWKKKLIVENVLIVTQFASTGHILSCGLHVNILSLRTVKWNFDDPSYFGETINI